MNAQIQDQIAGARAMAKNHREQAAHMRRRVRFLKDLPMGRRDPMQVFNLESAIRERVAYAQQHDKQAASLRATA